MSGPNFDGFYDLTANSDNFQVTAGLLGGLPFGLRGLEGNDYIGGSSAPEMINGNQGNDTVSGGEGTDAVYGGKGNDYLYGNQGKDILFGDNDADILFGGSEDDYLYGNQGNDQISGDKGNDILFGGKGDDLLSGLEGNDILVGDFGKDTLIGGEGQDTVVLRTDTAVNDAALADIIREFNNGFDRIGLTGGLTAADISLEIGSLAAGSSDTIIRVKSDGAILGWVEGVLPNQIGSDRIVSVDSLLAAETNNINNLLSGIPFHNSIITAAPISSTPINVTLDSLPPPFQTESATKFSQTVPIPDNPSLQVPTGFEVNVFAAGLVSPRWLAVTPTGDVLVAETSQNRISLLRDSNADGVADVRTTFASQSNGLNQPFGMVFADNYFYLGNTNAVVRFPYSNGQLQLIGTGEKIADLPTGGHSTRNLALSPDGQKLYVAIGSASNVNVEPLPRASVQVMNLDGSNRQTFAFGLRNPVGLEFNPTNSELYTVVNERDGLGDDLVPDYLTSLNAGEFYGWPYTYLSPNLLDPRRTVNGQSENPELAASTTTPDVLFQAHSAPLGLEFYNGQTFPQEYRNGAFVAFHGSWNRDRGTGYKVVFAPFDTNGNPLGYYQDFLDGFLLNPSVPTTWGRPTGLQTLPDGSMLVTDDANNRIYRIQY
ncbi:PQQ-dependent sugar dehydrogenase [Planktothrix sp. FACHB-1355]|uniref:PQQ-dependent sugar dehydrogenase n=1 Tax=Aerosakkonema funiforme FACHB-1375 TaxID=2949571 RepID=A0A926ZI04_9CYAN|nr:PQQ-dependent sugar dehydrogenase [Aerosakkonema funiforme]MBD2181296.1 PQQ-dependent sugar dehydrogenase [Aerosakkonema funiforme FACHB-1375]MBD3559917.1 PQQ-dependent sugar dehydrogenase [Planktothrix sp. FACHB-1355]